jgi:hypothetical protein
MMQRRTDCSHSTHAYGRDRGSVTGFVVVITLTVLCCAGLVIDGARVVAAKVSAADHAENAARVGAQQIVALRSSQWVIDPQRATISANSYLSAHGVTGTVIASAYRVTVTVQSTIATTLLRLVGVSSKTVRATRSADPISH